MTEEQKQIFVAGLIKTLRDTGYDYKQEGDEIEIGKGGVPVLLLGSDGECKPQSGAANEYVSEMMELYRNIREAYEKFFVAKQVRFKHLSHYRQLADSNGVIFAARLRNDKTLEFATWERKHINSRKGTGNYFEYYGHAKEDFAVRAGLADRNTERKDVPMFDKEQFEKLLLGELKRRGYDCTIENGEVKVSKNGFNVADILGRGECRVYRNTLNDDEYYQIRAIYESLSEACQLYEQGEPLTAQPGYHKLCELGNNVLAATMKLAPYGYMEFVTWQQDSDRTRVDVGHYHTDYEAAKQDFAIRAGLVDRNKMFDETEMKLIRQGLVHLGANFPDLTYDQNTLLGKIVEKIEMLVPEIREREELEHDNLVPDDGLEV